jgi:hypothetical protein
VRGLGCYGETAAPRNAPSQPTAAKHARWPWFCELRPERSGQWLHAKVVREGHQCPELCSGSNLPVMRFSVGAGVAGDAPHSSSVWERLHPARAACSYLLTCKRIIWSVHVGSSSECYSTQQLARLHSPVYFSRSTSSMIQACMCAQTQFTQRIPIRENADSPHARPTLRAALQVNPVNARQHRNTRTASEVAGSGTDSASLNVCRPQGCVPSVLGAAGTARQ